MSTTLFGQIKKGKLKFDDTEALNEIVKNEGKWFQLELNPADEKTKAQLGYLFGHVFKIVGDWMGCTPYEVYEIMLTKVPEVTVYHKVILGKTVEFIKRLSQMKRDEVGKFIDACVLYLRTSEYTKHLIITDPDPLWKE